MATGYTGFILNYNNIRQFWSLTNSYLGCNENEEYRTYPRALGQFIEDSITPPGDKRTNDISEVTIRWPGTRCAGSIFVYDDGQSNITLSNAIDNYGTFIGSYTNSSEFPSRTWSQAYLDKASGNVETNIPIFATWEEATAYVRAATDEQAKELIQNALNYKKDAEYVPDETEKYFMYNTAYPCDVARGDYKRTSDVAVLNKNIVFRANTPPAGYFTGNGFEVQLLTPDVIDYYENDTSEYLTETTDPINYIVAPDIPYHGPFYGNLYRLVRTGAEMPEDGNYSYGLKFNTNIYIFKNREDAEEAIRTKDYTKASNYYDVKDGNTKNPPKIGDEEITTEFGPGIPVDPWAGIYAMSKTAAMNLAGIFYTDDTSILDNIKEGLSLFGANPIQAIINLTWYPFTVSEMCTTISQNFIYFGSYRYQEEGFSCDKVWAMNSNYINAGTVNVTPIFNDYRDFSPYTHLSVFLPYSGWHSLEIEKYIGKSVNIRYYVDIYTNTGMVCLVADGHLMDNFPIANMGVQMPLYGSNMSEYANSALQGLLGAGGGAIGGALSGAMAGSVIPGVGTAVGAVAGGAIGGAAGIAKGVFQLSQKGKPKDHMISKGNFSSGIGSYMPQHVLFRYDCNDIIVPENLTELYGRPSSAGGPIGNFSGFLQVETVKLDHTNMTDSEAAEILSLLKSGIYV